MRFASYKEIETHSFFLKRAVLYHSLPFPVVRKFDENPFENPSSLKGFVMLRTF